MFLMIEDHPSHLLKIHVIHSNKSETNKQKTKEPN